MLTYKCSGLLSHYTRFVMFLCTRVIHTSPAVLKCNEHCFAEQKQPLCIKITYTCFIYPVLGQWLKFSQCPCLSSGLFSQFCTYMIFWPVIKINRNTNVHMHVEPTKMFFMNYGFLVQHSTLIYVRSKVVYHFGNF